MLADRPSFVTREHLPGASIAALGVVLLAFSLRVYRLADQNVWWDEGMAVWLARFDLASIALLRAHDEHPPLLYWLMHFWNGAAGTEAFAGRLLSVFFGVLMVAVMYRLAKRVGGAWFGVLAALLLALARFHVWWSQDIKDYTLSGFFALISVWCTLSIFITDGTQNHPQDTQARGLFGLATVHPALRIPHSAIYWVIYVLATALALYAHYLAALVFLANNLFAMTVLFLRWRAHPIPMLVRWVLAQLAALALFAPWLWFYLQHAGTWSAAPAFDFGLFLRVVATVFPLGVTVNIESYAPLVAVMTALAGIGVLWLFVSGQWPVVGGQWSVVSGQSSAIHSTQHSAPDQQSYGALLGLLMVIVPPLLVYLLSLTPAAFFRPKIQARYLLLFLPGYLLLLALGVAWLARFSKTAGAAALVFILLAQTWTLADYYRGRVLRDDYFTLANTINAFARPGDAVLLHTDQEWPTFLYYLRAPIPWSGVPYGRSVDKKAAKTIASDLASRADAVWVVRIPDALAKDPQDQVETRLAGSLPKQFEQTLDDKRLTLYASMPRDMQTVPPDNFWTQHPRADDFAPDLKLIGFDLPVREARGGDTLHVVTYWEAHDPVTVTLEIRDPTGSVVCVDIQPVVVGTHERVQSDLTLPPQAAGEYTIVALAKTTAEPLAKIRVTPRAKPATPSVIPNTVDYRLGEAIHLVGYDLPRQELRPGDSLALTLFWRSERQVEASYKVFVHLVGTQFNPALGNPLWGQVDQIPLDGDLPTTAWAPGDLIPDVYRVPLAVDAPPGEYQLVVGLYDPVTGDRLRVYDVTGHDLGDAIVIETVNVVRNQ